MPERKTLARARADKRAGKSPSTQAGEFVKEEFDHIRAGAHGARSAKQAIAIGLSKARRAGVDLPPPKSGKVSRSTQKQAARDIATGRGARRSRVSAKRSRATLNALRHEGSNAASPRAVANQAKAASAARPTAERSASAKKAARTKGPAGRAEAAVKPARTRAAHPAA
jgi:hypothetical protein